MQTIREQATPRASRELLTFTLGKQAYGIDILRVKDERFSERELFFAVTEAKPGQRRSAALDVSLS